jgi:hypothetical protein
MSAYKLLRCAEDVDGFAHVGSVVAPVLKEVVRRAELRPRLEAELGRLLTDEEFIAIAEADGVKI